MKVDFLLVGQGIAGTVLGLELERRQAEVVIVDPGKRITSSKVAAGLITPVTGGRVTLAPEFDAMFSVARDWYRSFEDELKGTFWEQREIVRTWPDNAQADLWIKRRENPDYLAQLAGDWEQRPLSSSLYHCPRGGIRMTGARLDIPTLLRLARARWEARGRLVEAELSPEEIEFTGRGVFWNEVEAEAVIFCTGAEAAGMPWFNWLPWRNASGDVLELTCPEGIDPRVVNGGKWMVPLGAGHALAGSTHNESSPLACPRDSEREKIEEGLRQFYRAPWQVAGHVAAIRPVFAGTRVLMGRHPSRPRVCLFNGLGSKGALKAPWHARMLADYLCGSTALPENNDIRGRFA